MRMFTATSRRAWGGLGLLLVLLAGCASPSGRTDHWQVPSCAELKPLIPQPPAPGSEAARLDLDTVLALQAQATPARIARARWTYDLTIFTFADAIGPDFTPRRYPQTAALFLRLNNLVGKKNDCLKNYFKRLHPYQIDPRVREIVKAVPAYSYPSFHSERCEVFRHTLNLLDPSHDAAFRRIAHEVMTDRVFAGEHFPTDITAGTVIGNAIFKALSEDDNFRAEVARVKAAEWTPPNPTR